jgi:L-arabinose isomerase
MIEDKVKAQLEFGSELNTWLGTNLSSVFDEVISKEDEDLDLYNNDEPLLVLEKNDVIINEAKLKNEIAKAILEYHISDKIFEMECLKSRKEEVAGYD